MHNKNNHETGSAERASNRTEPSGFSPEAPTPRDGTDDFRHDAEVFPRASPTIPPATMRKGFPGAFSKPSVPRRGEEERDLAEFGGPNRQGPEVLEVPSGFLLRRDEHPVVSRHLLSVGPIELGL
mmetsp:Transcript_20326/g.47780  ORF Transcript_20326/g.47780 Transcript_20326/m.47780 type:complete len:125 (-) Transcript_20326:792-1166(-)